MAQYKTRVVKLLVKKGHRSVHEEKPDMKTHDISKQQRQR
jgi:hypothetical protein